MKKPDPTVYSEDIAKYENIKRIEEKYNCAIEFIEVPWEQLESKLEESVLEGSPFADIVYLPMNFSVSAIAKGYLLPVSEFVSPNSDVLTDNIVVTLMGKLIDDEYGIKTVEVPDNGVFMGYNKSIIDELDLETPILSWMLEEIKGLSFEYGIVPFPTGPNNISGKTCAISYDAFYIPKGVKEPEKVYQVLEELLWFLVTI